MLRPSISDGIRGRHPLVAATCSRPVTLMVLMAATLMIGVVATRRIPLELFPAGLESRNLSIEIPLKVRDANLSPREVERRLTLPIEEELSTLSSIISLTAVSERNQAAFEIAFSGDKNLDQAYDEVRDRIERARARLDLELGSIRYRRRNLSSLSLAFLSVSWDDTVQHPFEKLSEVITPSIERVPGVAGLTIWGGRRNYYRVALQRERLSAYPGVRIVDVIDRLSGDNFSASTGKVADGTRDVLTVVDTRFQSLTELEQFPVGEHVLLRDIAEVQPAVSVDSYAWSWNWNADQGAYTGGRGAWGGVAKASDANPVEAGAALDRAIEALNQDPALRGMHVTARFNQGSEIVEQIGVLLESLVIGGALAVLVLLLFVKHLRLALLIAFAIPLSMTMALIAMFFAGETLNLFAIMGFTVAAGMLLDNAIVVVENIDRLRRGGTMRPDAAVQGTGEVGLALALATSTTVIVFLAIIFFSDSHEMRFYMARIGYPICASLAFSVLVAMVLIPAVSMRMGALETGSAAKPRRLYDRFWHWAQQRAGMAAWSARFAAIFFGRPQGTVARLRLGPWIAEHSRPWMAYGMAMTIGCAAGLVLAAVFVQGHPGDFVPADVVERIKASSLFSGDENRFSAFMIDGDNVHASLGAMAIVVACTLLPAVLFIFAPRREDASAPAPVISRMIRLYGLTVQHVIARPLRWSVLLLVVTAGLTVLGHALLGADDENPGNQRDISIGVAFPENIQAGRIQPQEQGEGTEEVPPEWEYFFTVRRTLFGIEFDGSPNPELQRKAFADYGIIRGAMSMRSRGMQVWVSLDPARLEEGDLLEEKIRSSFPRAAGFRVRGGFDLDAMRRIRVQISGPDFSVLEGIARELEPQFTEISGLGSVQIEGAGDSLSELALHVDHARALALGVDPATIARVISFHLNGIPLNDYVEDEVAWPVVLRMDAPSDRAGVKRDPTLQDVQQFRLPSVGGGVTVENATLAQASVMSGTDGIRRVDGRSTVTLVGQATENKRRVMGEIRRVLDAAALPVGYTAEIIQGMDRKRRDGTEESPIDMTAMIAAALLVTLTMGFLFESFMLPVVVLLACVPGAIVGCFWSLALTGTNLDVLCFLGLVILIGVSVNNGIVLVDLINRFRDEGVDTPVAVRRACEQRLRPILMTSLTTIFGLIPMAWGSAEFVGKPYYPLGRTLLGGMAVSTALTLVLIPLLYVVAMDVRERMLGLLRA